MSTTVLPPLHTSAIQKIIQKYMYIYVPSVSNSLDPDVLHGLTKVQTVFTINSLPTKVLSADNP